VRTGITVVEALETILEATPVLGPETVATRDAQGRVLAEDVAAPRTLPPADCSAMDGYALRADDVRAASQAAPVLLPVVFEAAAGSGPGEALPPGSAARIFTGAALPPGADSVARQEDVEAEAGRVRLRAPVPLADNVRPAGEDVRAGEVVLSAGALLGPGPLGLLAALGRSVVAVHQRPRVAIVSGGNELVEPDRDASDGRIVASNAYSLAAQCREAGAEPVYLGIARDTPQDLERLLRAGLGAECLVTSAGMSVGDHDHVRPVLEALGCRLLFWGVKMKPGYPFAFGRFEGRSDRGEGTFPLVFGLPGNPVSAMVTFEEFVRPALMKLAGRRHWFRPAIEAVLGETLRKQPGRLHFVRVALLRTQRGVEARSTGNQSSGVLRSMSRAQGLLVFPAEAERLEAGAKVRVQVIDPEFFAAAEAGL
jgi:molybdopterin molybdotransferase